MIIMRRALERHLIRRHRHDVWLTFYPQDRAGPLAGGFGALEILNEDITPPGSVLWMNPQPEAEIVTYVLEGALVQGDSSGPPDVVRAGEFQRLIAKPGNRHSATNASRSDWAHVFQMWLRPTSAGLQPGHETRRFSAAERRGLLCTVASPDGRAGSLRLHEDALLYSAILGVGQHLAHELAPRRMAWLHVVSGAVTLLDIGLSAGDGAGVTAERAVSLTAREETEILLLDLCEQQPKAMDHGGSA